MPHKTPPRTFRSNESPYFIAHKVVITGQVLAAKHWLKRHNFPMPSPN